MTLIEYFFFERTVVPPPSTGFRAAKVLLCYSECSPTVASPQCITQGLTITQSTGTVFGAEELTTLLHIACNRCNRRRVTLNVLPALACRTLKTWFSPLKQGSNTFQCHTISLFEEVSAFHAYAVYSG